MRPLRLFFTAPALLQTVSAIPWNEPLPTPQGILADAGWTPRPTEAPRLNGVPQELTRRQQDVIYPPPTNWCGFINGNYSKLSVVSLIRRDTSKPSRQTIHSHAEHLSPV